MVEGKCEITRTDGSKRKEGMKEAVCIKAMNPNLNRDGVRYSLPPV